MECTEDRFQIQGYCQADLGWAPDNDVGYWDDEVGEEVDETNENNQGVGNNFYNENGELQKGRQNNNQNNSNQNENEEYII